MSQQKVFDTFSGASVYTFLDIYSKLFAKLAERVDPDPRLSIQDSLRVYFEDAYDNPNLSPTHKMELGHLRDYFYRVCDETYKNPHGISEIM